VSERRSITAFADYVAGSGRATVER
jgi:hypothetical protein